MERFRRLIDKLANGAGLTREESAHVFTMIMTGEPTPAQMGGVLMALRVRGETVEEITGAATALRAGMRRVAAPNGAIDVAGTGGDGSGSYNISTCAAFIVAGAGVPVAKHGNRAFSSRSGAADVLGALTVKTGLEPAGVERCIEESGMGFMFAPAHHPALKHVAPVRVELATRTIFNILGPILNPAGVRHHLVGVHSRQWCEPMARVLGNLGSKRAWVVHGSDGLDEITGTGPTTVAELRDAQVRTFEITPEDVGLPRCRPEDLRGGPPESNAKALIAVLESERSPYRDVAVLNAAAALVAADRAGDLKEGIALAGRSIDSGQARTCLKRLAAASQRTGDRHE